MKIPKLSHPLAKSPTTKNNKKKKSVQISRHLTSKENYINKYQLNYRMKWIKARGLREDKGKYAKTFIISRRQFRCSDKFLFLLKSISQNKFSSRSRLKVTLNEEREKWETEEESEKNFEERKNWNLFFWIWRFRVGWVGGQQKIVSL